MKVRDNFAKFWRRFRTAAIKLMCDDKSYVVFNSRYSEIEIEELLSHATDEEKKGNYIQYMKDREAQYLIDMISKKESMWGCSVIVLDMCPDVEKDRYIQRYFSIEEYLVKMYNEGEEFTLYVTGRGDMYIKYDNRFSAIFSLKPEGDLLYRDVQHKVRFEKEELRFRTLCLEVLANPNLTLPPNEILEFNQPRTKQGVYSLRPKSKQDLNT